MATRVERGPRGARHRGGGIMSAARLDVLTPECMDRALRHAAAKINRRASWADTLDTVNAAPVKRAALKTWIAEGMEIETCQITVKFDSEGEPGGLTAWAPPARIVEDVSPSGIHWTTGSFAEFKGTRGYTATPEFWAGGYEWGANTLVLVIHRRLS